MEEKIRIMSFLQLLFSLPKDVRVVSFDKAAEVTQLNNEEVERLVMRSMSLDLVKGSID